MIFFSEKTWPHQTHSEQQPGKPGPISPSPVLFVNMMLSMRGLCLSVSKQLFVFAMLDSIMRPAGRPQPEWIPIYFPSPYPSSVKVASIRFDGNLKQ